MAFWTPSALPKLAQSESGGRADLIHYPTGYTRSGVRSSASGLYGFLDSTWQQQAARVGVDTTQYPRAYQAPADVQTYVAANTPTSHWTCPGCNTVATNLARDPSNISGTPTYYGGDPSSYGDYGGGGDADTGTAGGGSGGTRLEFDPDYGGSQGPSSTASGFDSDLGGSGGNVPSGDSGGYDADLGGSGAGAAGALAGAAGAAAGALGGSGKAPGGLRELFKAGTNVMVQIGLILLGIILIAAASWKLAQEST